MASRRRRQLAALTHTPGRCSVEPPNLHRSLTELVHARLSAVDAPRIGYMPVGLATQGVDVDTEIAATAEMRERMLAKVDS